MGLSKFTTLSLRWIVLLRVELFTLLERLVGDTVGVAAAIFFDDMHICTHTGKAYGKLTF